VKPIANLLADHANIMIALDAIEAGLRELGRGNRSLPFFEHAHMFVHVFADGAHYQKEELLFAAVKAQPVPFGGPPVAFLLMEHQSTLAESARMGTALAAIRAGNDAAWFDLAGAFARYTAIIRVHLPKENMGFFPMSENVLPPAVQTELGLQFTAIDASLPMTFAQAVQALVELQPGAAAPPAPPAPPKVAPAKFSDRFLLYDARLVSAMAALEDEARRRS
jgi:hemerythrin-like domain-containing protein